MKIHLAALALALALPAAAHAAPDPAPKAGMDCCCEKMDRKMECCEKHDKGKGQESGQGPDPKKGHEGHR
ncbi:MAG TPA: hypothetical protein VGB04_09190 [Allosphingosinicella sp.]|jgi:hypothetical protein